MTIDHIPARTAWGEARGQGSVAMQAVLCVIRNRVIAGGWWGDTYDGVCQKPYQFSCWNAGNPNLPLLEAVTDADPQFAEALRLEAEMLANTLPDITFGSDSYFAIRSPEPSWARQYRRTAVIGGQAFYQTRPLTTPRLAMAMTVPPQVSKTATFLEKWSMKSTTIQGAGVVATAVTAAALHQVTWLHATPGFVLGAVWMLLPEKDAALRKPLAAVVQDAVMALVTHQVNTAVMSGDVQALIAALRGLAAPSVDGDPPPPPNDPFPPAPALAAASPAAPLQPPSAPAPVAA